MIKKKYYFVIGLAIFYLFSFFSSSKVIYFTSYFVTTFFFYKATNNMQKSLLYSLILSLFSDFGMLQSLFMLEPQTANLGPGYVITPMIVFTLCLLLFSIRKKITIKRPDWFILLFYAFSLISFFIFPYQNVFLGIISLGEVILLYFILRIQLDKNDDNNISKILISLIIFQVILSGVQFLLQRPVGQIVETITIGRPYGITTPENTDLFRVSGTYSHPNFLASFILQTYSFLLFYPSTNILLIVFKILSLIVLVFTYSRAAWIIFIFICILLLITKQIKIKIPKIARRFYYLIPVIIAVIIISLIPYLNTRFNSFPLAFEEFGSMGVRLKTYSEAFSLMSQYPLTGVGLYRSIEEYANNPVTDLFEKVTVGRFYGIHNTFLEIASEIGIPGLFFFILFLFFVFKNYFDNKKTYFKNAAFFGLLGLLGISMFNPFFHSSQFRLFFLLSAIILA